MSSSTQYAALTRLLTLNNRVHDLERQLNQNDLQVAPPGQVAEMQEEMDREARATLVICRLALPLGSDD